MGYGISKIGICKRMGIGGSSFSRSNYSSFLEYFNPFGANKTFVNGEVIPPDNGVFKGTYTIIDTSTGAISIEDKFMKLLGDRASYTTTYLYGTTFERQAGILHSFSIRPKNGNLNVVSFGLCKSDLSSLQTGQLTVNNIYQYIYNSSDNTRSAQSLSLGSVKGYYSEITFTFIVGGFDSNGIPYLGTGNLADYKYGGYIFMRGGKFGINRLFGIVTTNNEQYLKPYYTVNEDRTDINLTKHCSLINAVSLPQPTTYISESNSSVITQPGSFFMQCFLDLATSSGINIKIALDDEVTPLNYIDIQCTRGTTNVTITITQYIAGVGTLIKATAFVYGSTRPLEMWYDNNRLFLTYYGTIGSTAPWDATNSSLYENTKILITNSGANRARKIKIYKSGYDDDCWGTYNISYPYYAGDNPPGYNLPGETRKGWHFDCCKINVIVANSITGVIMELTNGSSTAVVKYRNFVKNTYITELQSSIDLPNSYSGTSCKIFISSDPHYYSYSSYQVGDPTEILTKIVNPQLIVLGVSDAFVLGDLTYDAYGDPNQFNQFKADILVPANSISWHVLSGNHDHYPDFLNAFSGMTAHYTVTIGNCIFALFNGMNMDIDPSNNVVNGLAWLTNLMDTNTDKNIFICTHPPRANTIRSSENGSGYVMLASSDIDTALSGKQWVAWFNGHTHGWLTSKEPDSSVKLFLGNTW